MGYKCELPTGFFDFLEPPLKQTALEWVQSKIYLPQSESSKPGLLRLAPWFHELINLLDDPDIDEINIASASQVGKSLYEMAALTYFLCKYDQPAMLVSADQRLAESTLRRRLEPIIAASPSLRDYIRSDRDHKSVSELFAINASIRCAWAGSPNSLASFPAKLCVLDETAKYADQCKTESSAVELAEARMTQYRGSGAKLISVSTPVLEDDEFGKRFTRNQQFSWCFTCPHCGQHTFPAFENLVWDKEISIADLEQGKSIVYKCEQCQQSLEEKEYRRLVRSGKWLMKSDSLKTSRRRSYWLSGMLSQQRTFAYLVTKFLRVKDNPADLQGFYNSELGRFWIQQRIEIKEPQLQALLVDDHQNEVPADCMEIVAGIDVGGEKSLPADPTNESDNKSLHFWLVLLACMPGGRYQLIHTSYNDCWKDVEEKLQNEYYCKHTDKMYPVSNVFLDSGHVPQQAAQISIKTGITCSKGFDWLGNEFIKHSVKDSIGAGYGNKKYLSNPIKFASINTNAFKDRLSVLIGSQMIKINSEHHTELFKHLTSEVKKARKTKNGITWTYQPKYEGIAGHLMDALIYGLAASYARQHYIYATIQDWNMVNGISNQNSSVIETEEQPKQEPINDYGNQSIISPW